MTRQEPRRASEPAPDVDARGLTQVEAERRLAEVGPNALPEQKRTSTLERIGRQLRDPMILLLLAAGVVVTVLRDYTDMVVIAAVVVVNTAIGVVQELRSERAIAALERLSAPQARVLRDGRPRVVPAADLVPGDVVLIEAGDIVPADVELVEAVRLQTDESALTGESLPVGKDTDDEAHAGTVVTGGRGRGLVTATGPASALGRIAALIADQPTRPTPLQRRLAGLARVLTIAVLVIGGIVVLTGVLQGRPLAQMVVVAVSLAVAAVPESMPAVVALALALGAYRMAGRAAVVRRLPAVETLGAVTLIASDKTGTLTEGRMRAETTWTGTGRHRATGPGYAPEGEVRPETGPAADSGTGSGSDRGAGSDIRTTPSGSELEELLRDLVLCNDADVLPPGPDRDDWEPLGDPQEAALVALAWRAGLDVDAIRAAHPRSAEVPFDSTRRRMTTVHRVGDNGGLVVCKGAPEVVLGLPGIRVSSPDGDVGQVAAEAERLAADGYRVLAVAERLVDGEPAAERSPDELERDLEVVGLVGIVDPVRQGAGRVAATFRRAGIRLVLVTGDHPVTAAVIAGRLGIDNRRVMTGDELARATPAQLATTSVFARTRPEQKLDLVRGWQEEGEVVAMTGDGVNDAPALRRADIGVAMGKGGTEVARQAADLILLDDNLATVGSAVEEGRRIYANIRRFLAYALSGGVAEVLIMLVGPFLGYAVPLLPSQILWVNLLTHGVPGVAIGAEPAEQDAMRRPPRSPRESVLGRGLWLQVLLTGLLIAIVSALAAWWVTGSGGPWQSTVFVVLGLSQLGVALALRSRPRSASGIRFLSLAVAAAAVLQVLPLYVPVLRTLIRVESLTPSQLAGAAAFAMVPGLVVAVVRRLRSRSAHRDREPS